MSTTLNQQAGNDDVKFNPETQEHAPMSKTMDAASFADR